MKEEYVNKIRISLKNGTFYPTIVHALRNRWPLWWIRNRNLRALQLEERAYKKMKEKYKYILDNANEEYTLTNKNDKIVWFCWLQGLENAPLLVKRCYESLKENMSDFKINIVTEENMFEYVDIPDYIIIKWKKGIISFAHFSDLLRLNLLIKYGGVWIDSTVLCTDGNMRKYITEYPLFVYRSIMRGTETVSASNWLISSEPNNPILVLVQDLLYEYWKDYDVIIHYFLFHIFFTMAIEKYPDIWSSIPRFNNVNPHMLVDELNNSYSLERYIDIKKMSSFHKLNFKLKYNEEKGSFYNTLIINGNF